VWLLGCRTQLNCWLVADLLVQVTVVSVWWLLVVLLSADCASMCVESLSAPMCRTHDLHDVEQKQLLLDTVVACKACKL
jgi:hypothetical protein